MIKYAIIASALALASSAFADGCDLDKGYCYQGDPKNAQELHWPGPFAQPVSLCQEGEAWTKPECELKFVQGKPPFYFNTGKVIGHVTTNDDGGVVINGKTPYVMSTPTPYVMSTPIQGGGTVPYINTYTTIKSCQSGWTKVLVSSANKESVYKCAAVGDLRDPE